jgi:hypothetical protein
MKGKSMSETPVTFTSEEQLSLQQLNNQAKAFDTFGLVVSRSLYAGQDAQVVQQLLQFFQDIKTQSLKQVEAITNNATQRSQEKK